MMSVRHAPAVPGVALLAVLCALCGCGLWPRDSGPAPRAIDRAKIEDAVPRAEPRSRYGNPEFYEVAGRRYYPLKSSAGYVERGIASWYGTDFHGKRTSSGEPYDMYTMTAAHKLLPLPTYLEVTNVGNGARAIVRVNDRGPFKDNRVLDLSYSAAVKLGITEPGTGLVEIRAIDPGHPETRSLPLPPVSVFYLQAGAFRDPNNAERLRQRLTAAQDVAVTVTRADVGGTAVHRVRMGPFTDVGAADRVVAALERAGIEGVTVAFD